MKKIVVTVVFIAIITCLAVSQEKQERNRGIYFDAGLGFGSVSYNEELDQVLKLAEGLGADRTTIVLDLSLGWAVTQKLYAVGSISGFGDRIDFEGGFMQINTYLYGLGVRYYPMEKGLQLGFDFGLGKMLLNSNDPFYDDLASENGSGVRFTLAYDFDSTMTGPAAQLGALVIVDSIEGESIAGFGGYLNFVYK